MSVISGRFLIFSTQSFTLHPKFMANFKEQSGWCANCNRQVLGRKQEASHLFWLVATLFSCGLFALFWFFDGVSKSSKPFLCPQCGTALGSQPKAAQIPVLSPAMQKLAMNTGAFNPAYQTNAAAYQANNVTNSSTNSYNSLKCPSCGLTNFASATNCKRCQLALR